MNEKHTYFPLTIAQELNYTNMKYAFKKAVVNICGIFDFKCDIIPDIFLQALHIALDRCGSSHVRLHKVKNKIMQYISDEELEPVPVLDYSGRSGEDLENDLTAWSRIPFPHGSMDIQLVAPKMILKPNGLYSLYFRASHLAFDAYTLITIAAEAMEIYVALRDKLPLPEKKGDYLKLCELEQKYRESDAYKKCTNYWKDEVFATEPLFSAIEPKKMKRTKNARTGKDVNIFNSSAYHVNFVLDAELVNKVNELGMKMRISPQCIYLLAVRGYLSHVNGDQEDILIMNTVARRATLLQKNSGGTRVLAIPFRMNFSQNMRIRDALKKMSQLQAEYYLHSDIRLPEIIIDFFQKKFKAKPMCGYHSISVTYNPYEIEIPEEFDVSLRIFSNGASALPCYLTIMATDKSGALNFNYDCMEAFTTPETASRMHEYIKNALEVITGDPSKRLSELNDAL